MKKITELKLFVRGTVDLVKRGVDNEVGKGLVQYGISEIEGGLQAYFDAIDKEIEGLQADVRSAEAAHDQLMKVMEMQQPVFEAATQQAEFSPWTGRGRPPVGTVCEVRRKGKLLWCPATIKYCSESVAVGTWLRSISGEWSDAVRNLEFRPIRTPEQIAAEERRKQNVDLADQISGFHGGETTEADLQLAEYLYDHDYRKQVQP